MSRAKTFPSYAVLEVGTGRIDGWYRSWTAADSMLDYYRSEFPRRRFVVIPYTRRNAEGLGFPSNGYFTDAQKIPVFAEREEQPA